MRASGQLADKPYRWCFFTVASGFGYLLIELFRLFSKFFRYFTKSRTVTGFIQLNIALACLYYVFYEFLTMGFLESCTWVFYHFVVFPKFSWILFTNSWVLVGLPCVLVLWCSTTLPFHITFLPYSSKWTLFSSRFVLLVLLFFVLIFLVFDNVLHLEVVIRVFPRALVMLLTSYSPILKRGSPFLFLPKVLVFCYYQRCCSSSTVFFKGYLN